MGLARKLISMKISIVFSFFFFIFWIYIFNFSMQLDNLLFDIKIQSFIFIKIVVTLYISYTLQFFSGYLFHILLLNKKDPQKIYSNFGS